jgi:endonuclease YncB( thermonuclease family)
VISRHDGDTFTVDMQVWRGLNVTESIRVYGLDTREMTDPDPAIRALAQGDKDYAESLAPVGSKVIVRPFKELDPREKFGRFLAVVSLPSGLIFADEMIKAGHGVAYYGGTRQNETRGSLVG